MTQGTTQGLEELEDYLKRSYIGALRSDSSGLTDASATVFADYVMTRIGGLLRDQERTNRMANEQELTKARLDELQQLGTFHTNAIGNIHGRHERSYKDRVSFLTTQLKKGE